MEKLDGTVKVITIDPEGGIKLPNVRAIHLIVSLQIINFNLMVVQEVKSGVSGIHPLGTMNNCTKMMCLSIQETLRYIHWICEVSDLLVKGEKGSGSP